MGAGKFKGPDRARNSGVNNRDLDNAGHKKQSLFEKLEEDNPSIMDYLTPSASKNKFSDKKEWPSTLEEGKQGKHIEGHPNFQSGKSKLSISMSEAKNLVDFFAGIGDVVGNPSSSNKERVDFGKIIGLYNDPIKGYVPTTNGIIHHSSKGTHIVPSKPY
jgi:hypothetical protein